MRKNNLSHLFILFFIAFFVACEDKEVTIPDGAFDEKIIDLQGTWGISQVIMNNEDITADFDFSQFKMTLNMDGSGPTTFQIDGALTPFVVTNDGNWSYNDPVYPNSISFTTSDGVKTANFNVPPISTNNNFSLAFILGCGDNSYVYHFSKQQ